MAAEAAAAGKSFVLIHIPQRADLIADGEPGVRREEWASMTEHCPVSATCVDLLEGFPKLSEVDQGYNGTHYGPRTNAFIAEAVSRQLPKGPSAAQVSAVRR